MSTTLASILLVMVGTVFLVQSETYGLQYERVGAHDNARTVTGMIAGDLRSVSRGGIVVAQPDSVVIRSPMVMAAVCATSGSFAYVQFEGGEDELDTDEVGGIVVLNDTTNTWSYYNATWSDIDGGTAQAATNCYAAGADTVGATAEFHRMKKLSNLYGSLPPAGTILQIFRETTYALRTSALDSTTIGLYRGIYGDTLVEFATGMDSTAGFQYRTGGPFYASSVTGGSLQSIDAVRIVAEARKAAPSGGRDPIVYGWSVNVFLRNAR